ncbi:MAG: hypothetical protein LAT84_06065 [Balneolia bacterium]|nr:hypothetical protein [Balneolia bacterium]
MKKLIVSFVIGGIMLAGAVLLLNKYASELFSPTVTTVEPDAGLFTEEEIEMLNNYESELYQRIGSTKESSEYYHYLSYFDIPDSVKYTHEFTFYLLEFRNIREIHALGIGENDTSFISARTLTREFQNERNL